MKPITLIAVSALLLGAACSGTGASHQPVLSAVPGPKYPADLAECRTLAKSQSIWNAETRSQAAIGAVIGALAGLEDETISSTNGALSGAAVGAAAGAAAGAADTRHTRQDVLLDCLRNRGHPVTG